LFFIWIVDEDDVIETAAAKDKPAKSKRRVGFFASLDDGPD